MARVHYIKARKDYEREGIKKGDMYYKVSMKTGPRSSVTKRSLKPFKASQLTSSAFKSGWLGAQEEWEASDRGPDAARSLAEAIRDVGQEAQDGYDNMPEGLQMGDTGQLLENRASEAESRADDIESKADDMEALWRDDYEDDDDYNDALKEMADEVDDLASDIPE